MAVTTITPVQLARETVSADLPDASATNVATGTDGFKILATVGYARNVLIKFVEGGGGTSVVTINAGDKPPAITAGLGALTVTLTANDVFYLSLEQARFLQDDGTITGTVDDNDGSMAVFLLPRDI